MESLESIAKSHLAAAIDQQHEYESLEHAIESYAENARDTAISAGYCPGDAMDCQGWVLAMGASHRKAQNC